MASPQHLDALIGQALECASEAAGEVRALGLSPVDDYLKLIGAVTVNFWDLREKLYDAHPEVKRDFVKEYEVDEKRFNALTALNNQASLAESAGRIEDAAAGFQQLLDKSAFGFFKLCAEAGLYRTANAKK